MFQCAVFALGCHSTSATAGDLIWTANRPTFTITVHVKHFNDINLKLDNKINQYKSCDFYFVLFALYESSCLDKFHIDVFC